jgi:glycosyltransferase involved in cell wall biosynthesis
VTVDVGADVGADAGADVRGRDPGRCPRLLYVIGTYPSLTTTFIDREIEALQRRGVEVQVISLRRPDHPLSPAQRRAQREVRYVLPVRVGALVAGQFAAVCRTPWRYLRSLAYLLTRPHPSTRARWRTALHVAMAVHVNRMVATGPPVDHVHAHFVDRAATVAMVVSRLSGLPYSATAHAKDIYVEPVLLPEKLTGARFVATCTRYNATHLTAIGGGAADIRCVHHGIDAAAYTPAVRERAAPAARPLLLAVAQLREKKGLGDLLDAVAELRDRGYRFRCEIVGEGPLRATLERHIVRRSLGDVVTLAGALPHPAVVERYRRATVFTLPCVTAEDGDRDGIPNVILEAMAMELPVVATRHSGIPEVVEHGTNGLLVEPHDVPGLADALARVLDDPRWAAELGRRGRGTVLRGFDLDVNAARLLEGFAAPREQETIGG